MAGGPLPAQPYTNSALPIAQRVQDLLSRMTTTEKVAQLGSTWSAYLRPTMACWRCNRMSSPPLSGWPVAGIRL